MKIVILYLFIIVSIADNIQVSYDDNTQTVIISGNGTINQRDNTLYNLYTNKTKEIIIQNGK